MTFPVVAARTTTADPVAAVSHSINLGSPSAGDLIVVFATSVSSGGPYALNPASGDGWFVQQAVGVSILRFALIAKIANGSDVLTLTTGASTRMAATCYRITGHGATLAGGTLLPSAGATANADPPNAAFTGAAQDALFLTALANASFAASAAPAGYGSLTSLSAGVLFLSSAERTLNASSDNPGAWTNPAGEWITTTVAIPSIAIPTVARQSQQPVEVASAPSPAARATQMTAEVVSQMLAAARMTQIVVEMASQNVSDGTGSGPALLFIAT